MASFSCTDVESLLSRWNQETSTKFVDRCSSDTAVDIVNKLPWFEGIEELVWPEAYTPVGSPTTTTSTLSSSSSSSSSWYSGNSSSYMASSSSSSSSLDSHYRDVEYGDDTSLNSSFSFYVYNVIESGIPDSNDSNVIDASTTAESVIIAPTEEYSRSITSSSRCQSITSSSSRRGSDERQVSRLSWMHTTATVLRKQVSNSIIWRWCSTGVVRAARGAPGNFALKLLDLFPDESGQRNKKSRTIPFLPGRRLLSGKSNRELAEKRLPELHKYTSDLSQLPENISQCKHTRDFFKPRQTDLRSNEEKVFNKMTTLSDIAGRGRSANVTFFTSSSPSKPPHNNIQAGGRVSHTLPAHSLQSADTKEKESNLTRRSTYPARPTAFTPVISSSTPDKLRASSQSSIGSSDKVVVPTTTACHVVTPPSSTTRSPAFQISSSQSSLSQTSYKESSIKSSSDHEYGSTVRLVRPSTQQSSGNVAMQLSQSMGQPGHDNKPGSGGTSTLPQAEQPPRIQPLVPPTTTVSEPPTILPTVIYPATHQAEAVKTEPSDSDVSKSIVEPVISAVLSNKGGSSSWADKCPPPPEVGSSYSPFTASDACSLPPSCTTMVPAATFSPIISEGNTLSVKQRSSVPFSPSLPQLNQYLGATGPTHIPHSLTPTNFDSPTPSPKPYGAMWYGGYSVRTPTEADCLSRWLKSHRLHKYDAAFSGMTFEDVSKLTLERMKQMGLTQGAAKKVIQKMEELKNNNVTSFSELHFMPVSRRPSTSSLPAALLLEKQMTPSSSIDQHLSNFGSTCSLDIVGQSTSSAYSQSESGMSEAMIRSLDAAILEAGPSSSYVVDKGDAGDVMETGRSSRNEVLEPRQKVLKTQPNKRATPGATSGGAEAMEASPRGRVHSSPDEHPHVLSPTSMYLPAHGRKDIHSYPSGHVVEHHQPRVSRLPPVVRHPMPSWPPPPPPMGVMPPHNPPGPMMVPGATVPVIRGRFQPPVVPYALSNGPVPIPSQPQTNISGGSAQHGYLANPGMMLSSPRNHVPQTYSCYNCGARGHQGTACPLTMYNNNVRGHMPPGHVRQLPSEYMELPPYEDARHFHLHIHQSGSGHTPSGSHPT